MKLQLQKGEPHMKYILAIILLAVSAHASAAGTVRINGITAGSGNNIVISSGHVFVDGKDVTGKDAKVINIEITGNVTTLQADVANTITVSGSAGNINTLSGSVRAGDVTGSVTTMSGSVNSGKIGGDVSTMSGSVNSR
jgi:hypothetical protein